MSVELQELLRMGPQDLPDPETWPVARAEEALERIRWQVNRYDTHGYPDPLPTPADVISESVEVVNARGRVADPLIAAYAAEREVAVRAAFDEHRRIQLELEYPVREEWLGRSMLALANIRVDAAVSEYHVLSKRYRGLPGATNLIDQQMTSKAHDAGTDTLELLEQLATMARIYDF